MNPVGFSAYDGSRGPLPGSVPVTALVLTKDEAVNITRCLRSLKWCAQILVVDSGSQDDTVERARVEGADVVHHEWLGFAAQRQVSIRHPLVRHEWVYVVDADEWVSAALASEIEAAINGPSAAYEQRLRLVFGGRWIRHCGWYAGSWNVRLARRNAISYERAEAFGERAEVTGQVGRLAHDIVDEDLKGLAAWIRKHVRYAELEADRRRNAEAPLRQRVACWCSGAYGGRPRGRALAKDVVFPSLPGRPIYLFLYMYFVKAGYKDGRQGWLFCLLHAWHEFTVGVLARQQPNAVASDAASVVVSPPPRYPPARR